MKKRVVLVFAVFIVLGIFAFGGLIVGRKAISFYRQCMSTSTIIEKMQTDIGSIQKQVGDMSAKSRKHYDLNYDWMKAGNGVICHALGMIDGENYTNSREAFLQNYNKGYRVFEVDMVMTEDYRMVCVHDEDRWRQFTGVSDDVPLTWENYMKNRTAGTYTLMDADDLMQLASDYPDAYFVLDTKYTGYTDVFLQYHQIIEAAKRVDESVLTRFIPQIYATDMLDQVMLLYPFQSVIMTLYMMDFSNFPTGLPLELKDLMIEYCASTGLRFVTFPCKRWNDATMDIFKQWKAFGIYLATHTINDPGQAKDYFKEGIDMIYTDTVLPGDY